MAGDWIKMQTCLPDKPEVWQIAARVGVTPDDVVGKLLRVWSWFDSHTENGNAHGVSFSLVDRIAGVTGFAEAMMLAGWLEQHDMTLSLPHFERHNGKTAKNRALTNERVKRHRNDDGVTESLPEKRREEKKEKHPPTPRKRGSDEPEGFADFWSAYPRKTAKPAAIRAYAKLQPDEKLRSILLAGIRRQSAGEQWRRDGGQYIPHPATWLNGRRWEDQELEPPKPVTGVALAAIAKDDEKWRAQTPEERLAASEALRRAREAVRVVR